MKSLWRKIGFILAWAILVLGTVAAIINAVTYSVVGFAAFCEVFVPALFFFTMIMIYLEHTNNVEMRIDQTYRKSNNLPQLPESAYTNLPISSSPAPQYQQPMVNQPMMQQPVAQQPVASQPIAPQPMYQQPVAPVPTPAPAPAQQAAQGWTCPNCNTVNSATANFCKGCGNKKS